MNEVEVLEDNDGVSNIVVPKSIRDKIIVMLTSGEFPVNAEIARLCNVPVSVVDNLLESDTRLKELRYRAELEMVQLVERSVFDLAINGRNEIAREKMMEFILKNRMTEKYGENNKDINNENRKRILVQPKMKEIPVDENGVPIESKEQEQSAQ